jgi:hypothetical protein
MKVEKAEYVWAKILRVYRAMGGWWADVVDEYGESYYVDIDDVPPDFRKRGYYVLVCWQEGENPYAVDWREYPMGGVK